MKWLARIALVALLAVLLTPAMAGAAEFRGGQEATTVPAGQTVQDDLYIAGQTVTISGTVNGDLVVAGSNVTVDGTVTGSVWAAGSTVTINGTVGHSVRAGGSTVTIKGQIAGDGLAGGATVTVDSGAAIGRDLIVGASQLTVNGTVGRNVKFAADQATLGGPVKGSVTARSGNQFTLAQSAAIGGGINYSGPAELHRDQGAKVAGAIDYTKVQARQAQQPSIGERLAGQTYWFIAAVLLLLAILLYARRAAVRAADLIGQRPGGTVLAGLAFLILAPVVGFIFFITIFGIPLSAITFLGYGLLIYTAKLFPALAVGRAVLRGAKPDSFWPTFGVGVLGLAAYYLLAALPVVGWLVGLAALLFGLGAQLFLFREIYGSIKQKYGA